MCWLFIHSSFSVLNTALPPLMPSRSKRSTRSAVEKSSWSSPGDHPRSARKFTIASGTMPCAEYSITDVAPWRLLSRFLSGPMISGTCAKPGTGTPSAWYSSTCFGVFEMWSSPRITWVMRMSMSSTTTDR